MEQAARAAGIADRADPDTGPSRDVEQGRVPTPYGHQAGSASRVSLPQSHRRSMSLGGRKSRAESTRSRANSYAAQLDLHQAATGGADPPQQRGATPIGTAITTAEPDPDAADAQDADGAIEEIPWGPEHPCFPHPNPHVPMASPLYANTRIIRVRRDWMLAGDFAPTFTLVYPEILEYFPCLGEPLFRELVEALNTMLLQVFTPWNKRSWVDTVLGVATGWLWDDFGVTSTEKGVEKIENFLESWNVNSGAQDGVRVISLKRTGYLSLDIQIPDPQIVEGNDDFETEIETQTDGEGVTEAEGTTEGTRTREGSLSARSASNTSGSKVGAKAGEQGPQPTVPPIPKEFLEESAALAVTMGGFRNSDEEERKD